MIRSPLVITTVVSLLSLSPGQIRAEAPARNAGDSTVDVDVVGGAAPAKALFDILRELLGKRNVGVATATRDHLDLATILGPQDANTPKLARVYVDLSRGTDVAIYLLDGLGNRALIRSVATSDGTVDELVLEATAHIIEAAVGALLDGATIGVPRQEALKQLGLLDSAPPAPAAVQVAPAPPPSPAKGGTAINLAFTYEVGQWADETPMFHGPGLSLGVLPGSQRRWGARLASSWRWARDAEPTSGLLATTGAMTTTFSDLTLRSLALFQHALGPRALLDVAAGPGLDLGFVSTTATGAVIVAQSRRTIVDPILALQIGLSVRVVPGIWAALRVTLDMDLVDTHYVLARPGGPATIANPHGVRPGIQLALGHRNP